MSIESNGGIGLVLVLVRLSDWLFKIALPISEEALFSQPIKFASKRKSCFGFGFTQVSLTQFLSQLQS